MAISYLKNKGIMKFAALIMIIAMLFMVSASSVLAENDDGQVRVIIENLVLPTERGAAWFGTLVDKQVDLNKDSTMMNCIVAALGSYSQTGAESNYISEINGLSAFDGGSMSGWMGTLNDWFTNEGFDGFTVQKGTLKDGDEIRLMYTCDYGEDLGGSWSNDDKSVKAVTFSTGKLDKAFSPDVHAYTLNVTENVEGIIVTPTAANKNYQVRTSVDGIEYARSAKIPVMDGSVITVKCGDPAWPTMNQNSSEAQVYTFTVAFPEITVYTSLSMQGMLMDDMACEPLKLTGKASYTIDDAFVAMHEVMFGCTDENIGEYYSASASGWITTFCGIENPAVGYQMNKGSVNVLSVQQTINNGDHLDAYIYQDDTYYSDMYSCFTSYESEAVAGEGLELTLLEYGYDASYNLVGRPCADAIILVDGEPTEAITDENGKAVVTFTTAGIHTVSAVKEDEDDIQITAPCCKVTVKEDPVIASGEAYGQYWSLKESGKLLVTVKTSTGRMSAGKDTTLSLYDQRVTSVEYADGIKSLANYNFVGLENLTEVRIPASVTSIAIDTFTGADNLTTVVIEEGSPYKAEGNFILKPTATSNTIAVVVNKKKVPAHLEFPEGVTDAATNTVFSGCKQVESLSLPYITKITTKTVYAFSNLQELFLSADLTEYTDQASPVHPAFIYYPGTQEQWESLKFGTKTLENLAKYNSTIVFNYSEEPGTAPVITTEPEDATVFQGGDIEPLQVAASAEEGAQLLYTWYCGDVFVGTGETCTPDLMTLGTFEYSCEVKSIKDGKIGSAKTRSAVINVLQVPDPFEDEAGTQEDPYTIDNAEEMNMLRMMVNSGNSYAGKYFVLTADIELPKMWKPMGCTIDGSNNIKNGANMYPFSGNLDGKGHTIIVPEGGLPLIGYIQNASVKNLNVYGERIEGYGLVNNFEGVGLSGTAITIDNVTIKSGTKTLKSGIIGANITTNGYAGVSNGFKAIVKNCVVEKGVVIGYTGTEKQIGSIAGRMQGTVENCVSYADVYGSTYVGGIIGCRDNSMGTVSVSGCRFLGTVTGQRDVGGIAGSVYQDGSAPNGVRITIKNCVVKGSVSGTENVGGILGSDNFIAQAWNAYSIAGNTFSGTVTGENSVGAIIGYYKSLNKYDDIKNNFYDADCGAEVPFGTVWLVDTNCENPTPFGETIYVNTETDTSGCPKVSGCSWKKAYNRTDDPLGADIAKLASVIGFDPEEVTYDVTLPEGVTEIEAETFCGDVSIKTVMIPDTCVAIDTRAFAGCESMTVICIPRSVENIANDAFDGASMVIIGYADSAAQAFADANGFVFEMIGE